MSLFLARSHRAKRAASLTCEEFIQQLQSLPFCQPHPKRSDTWILDADFRKDLQTRSAILDRWSELNQRAAEIFEHRLEETKPTEQHCRDANWIALITEWVYHLLMLDSAAGIRKVRTVCAQADAIPVFNANWEIEFCILLMVFRVLPVKHKSIMPFAICAKALDI